MKRKTITALLLTAVLPHAMAQTMNVVVGDVTYQVPSSEAGEMTYGGGTTLTVIDKTFSVDEIDKIYVDETAVTASRVNVTYSASGAKVEVPYNLMSHLSVGVSGGHVSIVQDSSVSEEVTYHLSGTSSNGSFYMDGKLKTTLQLDGVTLTNPDSAAINIRCGKRINVVLADGTTSTLTDGSGGSQKACFAVKGHTEFDGGGTLNITGKSSHAFWGKEYVQLKKNAGTINILGAKGDGFNVNQYYQQNGGTVTVSGVSDDGIQVSYKTDDSDQVIPLTEDEDNTGEVLIKGGTLNVTVTATGAKGIKAEGGITINEEKNTATVTVKSSGGVLVDGSDLTSSSCMKSDTQIQVDGGTLNLTNSGQGGRAMLSEKTIIINGGSITASATGSNYGSSGGGGGRPGGGGWPWGSGGSSSNSKNAKCIKAKGALTINGGTLNATSSNHEGVESKSTITINGGTIYVKAGDDAINSSGNMTINDGHIYAYSTSNDGLDSNGNMYIKGGVAVAFGGRGAETGIDIDEQHSLSITGGQLFGIGGRIDSRFSSCTQAYGYTTKSITSSGYFVLATSSNAPVFAVKVPASYSGIVLVSSPSMSKSTSYKVVSLASSKVSGTEENGFIASPTATISSSDTNATFTSR